MIRNESPAQYREAEETEEDPDDADQWRTQRSVTVHHSTASNAPVACGLSGVPWSAGWSIVTCKRCQEAAAARTAAERPGS